MTKKRIADLLKEEVEKPTQADVVADNADLGTTSKSTASKGSAAKTRGAKTDQDEKNKPAIALKIKPPANARQPLPRP
ncbi:MAG: hypothetical protein HC800_07895 [Phormidesmis sp. RL_2_1]|nr:hypothetical protein [Phormidesmis sp. RL_2_1]